MDAHVGTIQARARLAEAARQAKARMSRPIAPEGGESSFLAPPSGIKFEDVGSPEDVAQFNYEAMLRQQMAADFYSMPTGLRIDLTP